MKKAAALSLASFYLLLTTGLFVCNFEYGTYFLCELAGKDSIAQTSAKVEKLIAGHEKQGRAEQVCSYMCSREVLKPVNDQGNDFFPLILHVNVVSRSMALCVGRDLVRPISAKPLQGRLPIYLQKRVLLI